MALVRVNEQGRRIGESHRNARHSDEDVERAIAAYEVLRPAGAEHTPEQQGAGRCDACRHSALPRQSWPGSDFGVRAPYPGEAPLSWSEVLHAQVNGGLSLTTDPPGRCPTPPIGTPAPGTPVSNSTPDFPLAGGFSDWLNQMVEG